MLFSAFSVYAASYTSYVTPISSTPLYQLPDASGYSFGTISSGEVMGVLSSSGDFYYVYIAGRNGYVLKSACTYTSSTSVTNATQTISQYRNTTITTSMYSSAYTYSSTLATISAGTSVGIINTSNDFYYVYYNNQYGYVPTSAFGGSITGGSFTATAVSTVALYSTANTSGIMLTTIPIGTSVNVISTSGGFYYLTYNGYNGYAVASAFTGGAGSNVFSTSTYSGTTSTTPVSNADGVVAYGTVAAGTALLKTAGGVTMATFPNGGQLGIISKTSSGYYYVSASGYKGYVLATSVSLSSATTIPVSDTAATISSASVPSGGKSATIVKCKTNVNMRAEASSSSALLGAVPKGASITAYGKSGSYTQINYNGTMGYVLSKYVKK